MNPVEKQFEVLKAYEPTATLEFFPEGFYIISIPNIKLPAGWSKENTQIKFIAPVGYPLARPDCFWADTDLRLANGNMPQNAQPNATPPVLSGYLWFSWHLSTWNPNNDNLLTYINVIKRRLSVPQ
jgi:hypothetical protein